MNYDHIIHYASPAAARASSSSFLYPFSLCIFVEAGEEDDVLVDIVLLFIHCFCNIFHYSIDFFFPFL